MKSFRNIKRNSLRKALIFFLTYCMLFNTSLPVVLALEQANVVSSSGATFTQWGDHSIIDTDNGAVINWNNFDTSSTQSVTFNQYIEGSLSSNSAVLNRISGAATQFDGILTANGNVFIVNPAGVIFGATSSVNVNQLVASSLDIADGDFIAGHYEFIAGEGEIGGVTNYGQINAAEGVALIGKHVRNNGSITTGAGGFAVMAAGDRVFLGEPGSSILVEMNSVTTDNEGDGEVTNNGEITAPAGTVVLAAGDVFSSALELPKVSNGTGTVEQNGTIDVDGTTGDGGGISLTAGNEIVLASGSLTTANAGTSGDAGLVVVHSKGNTIVEAGAQIEAVGGHEPHDIFGDFDDVVETTVEISGESVNFAGDVDASATNGKRGKIVIDAADITVADGSMPDTPPDNTIYEQWIEDQSDAATDVELLAHSKEVGNIIVEDIGDGEITGGSGDIVLRTKYDTGGITFLGDPAAIHTTEGGNVYMLAGSGGIIVGDIMTDVPSSDKTTEPGKIRLLTTNEGDITTGELSVDGGSYVEISAIADGDLTVNGDIQTSTNQVPSDTQEVGQARTCLVSEHGDVVVNGTILVDAHGKFNTTADIHIDAGQDIKINLDGGQIRATAKTTQTGPANASVLIHAGKDIEGPGNILITDNGVNPTTRSNAIYVEAKGGGGSDSVTLTASGQSNVDLETTVGNAHGEIEVDNDRTAECPECPTPPGLVPPLDPWAYTTHMGDPISGNVLPNGSLEVINYTEPSHGTLIINENGDYEYIPDPGFVGQDRFTYQAKVTDTGVETDWVEVTIDVINALPVANPSSEIEHMGVEITNQPFDTFDVSDGLAVDDITVTVVTQPSNGTVTVQKVGDTWTYTYTPDTDESGYYVGTDTFTYSVTDGQLDGEGNPIQVTGTIQITLTNTPPVQSDDSVSTNQGQPLVIDVLANDYDPDHPEYQDELTVVQDSITVQHGTLVLNEDGTFTYIPEPGYVGEDTFTYAVQDGQSGQELVWTTVTISVNAALLIPAAQIPENIEFDVSGCPALLQWAANELGLEENKIEIWMTNTLANLRGVQPCEACARLRNAAFVLQDVNGTYVAALTQVINEYASSTAPPSEEQMASIADAIANNAEADNAYALAEQYLDALTTYVSVVSNLGLSTEDAITVATDKYIAPLIEEGNVGLAAYITSRLTDLAQ
jgi:filamentous hemagglutinin family protein